LPDIPQDGAALRAALAVGSRTAGIDLIPSNDLSLRRTACSTPAAGGRVPKATAGRGAGGHRQYFAMARGVQSGGGTVTAMEMTMVRYQLHYLVPEFEPGQDIPAVILQAVEDSGGERHGHSTKLRIGPVNVFAARKGAHRAVRPGSRCWRAAAGICRRAVEPRRRRSDVVQWTAVPALRPHPAERRVRARLRFARGAGPKLNSSRHLLRGARRQPHQRRSRAGRRAALDVVRAVAFDACLQGVAGGGGREGKVLSLGVIDGRNIWKADLPPVRASWRRAGARGRPKLWVGPVVSL